MIYYKLNDVNSSILEKYFINYDIDILKKLQKEVVWKCGEKIFHKVQMGENYRRTLDGPFMIIHSANKVGVSEDFYGDIDIYEICYTEYKKPKLFYIIQNIIDGRISGVKKLLSGESIKLEFNGYDNDINDKQMELYNDINDKQMELYNDINIDKKISILNEIKSLYEKKSFNSDRVSISFYYDKVISLISIEYINSIDINMCKETLSFFNYSLPKINDNLICKKLKRTSNSY